MPTRIAAGTLQIRFGDETHLAELVEALEAIGPVPAENQAA